MSRDTGIGGASVATAQPNGPTPREDDSPAAQAQRAELARFLRTMRDRLAPESLGLTPTRRRRAPGLLREEVAQEAGISATWLTWLEQARPIRPSTEALDSLARALRLDDVQRDHLFRLAQTPPPGGPAPRSDEAAEIAATLIAGLGPFPAYAYDRTWDVIAQNDSAAALLGRFEPGDPITGNILARMFLDEAWRRLFVDWPEVAQAAAAQFRASTADIAATPEVQGLLDRLTEASPAFAAVWRKERLQRPAHWEKTLEHPRTGRLRLRYSVLRPEGEGRAVRLSIYTPADAAAREALNGLAD